MIAAMMAFTCLISLLNASDRSRPKILRNLWLVLAAMSAGVATWELTGMF